MIIEYEGEWRCGTEKISKVLEFNLSWRLGVWGRLLNRCYLSGEANQFEPTTTVTSSHNVQTSKGQLHK